MRDVGKVANALVFRFEVPLEANQRREKEI